jgi:four helix bundle protein
VTAIQSYRDLEVWKRAMDLAVAVYETSRGFPIDERFGLTSQVRRSAASVAANIAEGYGRQSRQSYVHFLKIAQGSLKETETHLILASRVGMIDTTVLGARLDESEEIGRMLRSLITKLENHQGR